MTIPAPPQANAPRAAFALWNFGFRPFYFFSAVFAAASIPAWAAQFAGWLGPPALSGPLWHAHEMLFGYAFGVIVGFLFTAGRNWSNQATPTGASLAAILALWAAARIAVLAGYALAAAVCDGAFALAAAAALALPFWRSRNRRNYFFVPLLLALGAANLAFYFAMTGEAAALPRQSLQAALDVVLFTMVVMGARVIPMFTMNAIPEALCARKPWIERLAPSLVLLLLAADVFAAPDAVVGPIAGAAAIVLGLRFILWRPWVTRRVPLLWILHLSYAWIVAALLLRALAAYALVPPSLATHALTVGGIGGLTLGMMTRSARGHTGRALVAGRAEIFCYCAVEIAALARVFLPLAFPAWSLAAIIVSALFWMLAFGVFSLAYWPVLSRPRLDGKPG